MNTEDKEDMLVDMLSVLAHNTLRTYCRAHQDFSQPAWEDTEEWQRDSTYQAVRLHLAQPDLANSATHDAWAAARIADGWKYGPVKDTALKINPCLVPFEELSPMQRGKDALMKAVVHSVAPLFKKYIDTVDYFNHGAALLPYNTRDCTRAIYNQVVRSIQEETGNHSSGDGRITSSCLFDFDELMEFAVASTVYLGITAVFEFNKELYFAHKPSLCAMISDKFAYDFSCAPLIEFTRTTDGTPAHLN